MSLLLSVYHSLVTGVISYCICVWGNASRHNMSRLILCQKFLLRTLDFAHGFVHSRPLFVKYNILNVNQLYMYRSLLMLRKKLSCGFVLDSRVKFRIENFKTVRRRKTLVIQSRILHNNLPLSLRGHAVEGQIIRDWIMNNVIDDLDTAYFLLPGLAV